MNFHEDVIPLWDAKLSMRVDQPPGVVTLVPEGEGHVWKMKEGLFT